MDQPELGCPPQKQGKKNTFARNRKNKTTILFFFFVIKSNSILSRNSTSFQTRPLGHRLGPPTEGSWKSTETERMAPGKKKKKRRTHSTAVSGNGEKESPPFFMQPNHPTTDRASLTRESRTAPLDCPPFLKHF